jgi:ribosomal protein L7Ae-like RNA K-turn-binding protein
MVGNVVLWWRWWWLVLRDVVVWQRWRVGIELVLHLIERSLLPLILLAKDVDAIL